MRVSYSTECNAPNNRENAPLFHSRCLSLRPLREAFLGLPLREALLTLGVFDQGPGCFPGLHRRHGRAGCVRVHNRAFHQKRKLVR